MCMSDIYICRSKATPAKTHLAGRSFVFRLNVQMYVGPKKKGFKISCKDDFQYKKSACL